MPKLYKKRPLTVEAVRFEADRSNIGEVLQFLIDAKVHHLVRWTGILIRTVDGDMLAEPGDYIIRGMREKIYPCKPDDFDASYMAVNT